MLKQGIDDSLPDGCDFSAETRIGAGFVCGPNVVTLGRVIMGDNVTIGANTVIGGRGFAFNRTVTPFVREAFLGYVSIGDNVEIGNNCNIDRGRTATTIGNGCKIDSLVHVAHDCEIGNDTIIAGGAILGGHAKIGSRVRLGLNSTVRNRAIVDDDAVVGMHTPVLHRVAGKKTLMSTRRVHEVDTSQDMNLTTEQVSVSESGCPGAPTVKEK